MAYCLKMMTKLIMTSKLTETLKSIGDCDDVSNDGNQRV